MTDRKTIILRLVLGLLAAGASAQSSAAFEPPVCKEGEYFWLLTAGNQATQPLPSADVRRPFVPFTDYIGTKHGFRTAVFTDIPKGRLGEAQTLERFSGGGNLGWFSRQWPIPIAGYETGELTALPPRTPPAIGRALYPSHFSSARLLDGAQGETVAQVLSAPDFDGRLYYIVDQKAAVDFVAIAMCSSALPPKPAPKPPEDKQVQEPIEENTQEPAVTEVKAEIEPAPLSGDISEPETEIVAEAVAEIEVEAETGAETETEIAPELEADLAPPNQSETQPETQWLPQTIQAAAPAAAEKIGADLNADIETETPLLNSAAIKTQAHQGVLLSAALALSALLNALIQILGNAISRGMNRPKIPASQDAPNTAAPRGVSGQKASADSAHETTADVAVIFPHSPSFSTGLPQSGAGLAAAYAAVGRIGYTNGEKVHTGKNGYGSGILIAPDKILTNMHVYYTYLHGQSDENIGIEFKARDGSDESEFIPFKHLTAQSLTGMDAVVMTLKKASTRTPIWPHAHPQDRISELDGQEVYAIGYPLEPGNNNYTQGEIELVFGKNPVWGVKRWTEGKIVTHEDDISGTDILFDVRARVDPFDEDNNNITILAVPALCHDASTLGGNSGGALIAKDTGALIGLHFGGREAANYAVPAHELLRGLNAIGLRATPAPTPPVLEPVPELEPQPEPSPKTSQEPEPPQTSAEPQPSLPFKAPEPIAPTIVPAAAFADDLTRIEGIGPKTREALRQGGITRFSQLAQGSPYDLLPILASGGLKRRDPTTWPAQAALAAAGDWETLAEWQAQLHYGQARQ